MRNKELKAEIKRKKETPYTWIFEPKRKDDIARLERWLKSNSIRDIFSELITTYIDRPDRIITITDEPIDATYIQVMYDYDGYRIEYRCEQKLHLIGLSKKDFEYLKNKFEVKGI